MKFNIVDILTNIYLFVNPNRNSKALTIVINETNIERKKIFKELFKKIRAKYPTKIEIVFPKNRLDYIAKSKTASVIYTYGISKYLYTTKLILLYIGQVGVKSVEKTSYKVFNSPNFASNLISDYVISSVFSYERGLLQNLWERNNYHWNQKGYTSIKCKNLKDIKIGIIGLGNIGKQCAIGFKNFGCEVHGFDIKNKVLNCVDFFYSGDKLGQMLPQIDYLILSLSNIGNNNFLDKSKIDCLNKNCCVVNVSRSSVLDEEYLIESINSKRIRGAILDVFSEEPVSKRSKIWKIPGLIITPHIAGNIDFVFNQIVEDFYSKIEQEILNV